MTTTPPEETTFKEHSALSRCIALTIVVLALVETRYWMGFGLPLLALIGIVAILCLNDADAQSIGLRLVPVRGWKFWCYLAIFFGFVIGGALVICAVIWLIFGWTFPTPYTTRPELPPLIFMCFNAPFSEEMIFRVMLTIAVLPTLGERGTIIAGGVVFALLHILSGNPGPDNQIAGFMLGWAFMKSKTILVPIAMHSAGNLIALGSQVAAWYLY